MIQRCNDGDFDEINAVINDSATAYRGVIPPDRWHDPYMTVNELRTQIEDGVEFWKYMDEGQILGVMGIQEKGDVTLIRHAYTRTTNRGGGIGSKLLDHLLGKSSTPVLIGTWADASWAIRFYQKHGFRALPEDEKESLLQKYWSIPERQIETSVVLASADWEPTPDALPRETASSI
jgi:N-acetylglutamate synthase-like GNAT family acetyltransferase